MALLTEKAEKIFNSGNTIEIYKYILELQGYLEENRNCEFCNGRGVYLYDESSYEICECGTRPMQTEIEEIEIALISILQNKYKYLIAHKEALEKLNSR